MVKLGFVSVLGFGLGFIFFIGVMVLDFIFFCFSRSSRLRFFFSRSLFFTGGSGFKLRVFKLLFG